MTFIKNIPHLSHLSRGLSPWSFASISILKNPSLAFEWFTFTSINFGWFDDTDAPWPWSSSLTSLTVLIIYLLAAASREVANMNIQLLDDAPQAIISKMLVYIVSRFSFCAPRSVVHSMSSNITPPVYCSFIEALFVQSFVRLLMFLLKTSVTFPF